MRLCPAFPYRSGRVSYYQATLPERTHYASSVLRAISQRRELAAAATQAASFTAAVNAKAVGRLGLDFRKINDQEYELQGKLESMITEFVPVAPSKTRSLFLRSASKHTELSSVLRPHITTMTTHGMLLLLLMLLTVVRCARSADAPKEEQKTTKQSTMTTDSSTTVAHVTTVSREICTTLESKGVLILPGKIPAFFLAFVVVFLYAC
ncbi:hypothetical protein LSAT2_000577 [Lamellibrachia satsuma]|nr:hypothetical protein LSAT2_000577 [Lamellibrachia satsuma]